MKKSCRAKIVQIVIAVFWAFPSLGQVTLEIKRIPDTTPATDTLFLAGNLNNWNPRSLKYAFSKAPNNRYYLTLPGAEEGLEYKITRGSWATGETIAGGAGRANRTYQPKTGKDTVQIEVENWQDDFETPERAHTAAKNVQVLNQNFWMPQLKKSRRVWLYLPRGYDSTSKRYPVLYMHDGQNLFDEFYSFSGEWGVDESLNRLSQSENPEVIVVGIDNGGEERMHEYNPWVNDKYGGGKGDAYVDFLAQTLKPYIDAHYRTLPDKGNTGVAGSSMGGLISLYAALKFPDVFGKAGVFSPAFWISPEVYDYAGKAELSKDLKVFLVGGAKEGKQMVPDMTKMRNLLAKKGMKGDQLHYVVHKDGKHIESYWQREFAAVFKWLFAK